MTGEVSLKGNIGAVGGVPQKVVAAFKRGRKVVILPKANAADLDDVPAEVRRSLDIRLVETVREAIDQALE
jgi:ATP-dependent Lon protease